METNTFHLVSRKGRDTCRLIEAGKYYKVQKEITYKNFWVWSEHDEEIEIEFIEFDFDPMIKQVLAEAERRGLKRPGHREAFLFGEQYPQKQLERPIIFLHKPVLISGMHLSTDEEAYDEEAYYVLMLFGIRHPNNRYFDERFLVLQDVSGSEAGTLFPKHFVFAFVRSVKQLD